MFDWVQNMPESETKKKRENANAERGAFDTFEDFDDKNLQIY